MPTQGRPDPWSPPRFRPWRSNITGVEIPYSRRATVWPQANRKGPNVSIWFEGDNEIECDIRRVKDALQDHGAHFAGVVGRMPGITDVELLAQGTDSVTIKTNEGIMKRTNIRKRVAEENAAVEFDEVYEAGSKVTVTSHIVNEFSTSGAGVKYHLVISDVEAPGFLGLSYRKFGSSKMGNAYLAAYAASFEDSDR